MRNCPRCGIINSDEEQICGVCGADLSASESLPMEKAERAEQAQEAEQIKNTSLRVRVDRAGPVILIAGIVLLVVGLIFLYFLGGLGIVLIVGGLFLVLIGISSTGGRPVRPMRVWR